MTMANERKDRVLTVKEAAKLVQVSEKSIRYLVKTYQVPHQRLGRNKPRFSEKALLEWVQAGIEIK
jgi:excisionase family DNA binding protein